MYQTLKEVLDEQKGGKGESPFYVRMPTGKKREFKSLSHMQKELGDAAVMNVDPEGSASEAIPKEKRSRRQL